MKLTDLIETLPVRQVAGPDGPVEIDSIAEDSRRVDPGGLFVARPGGATDGRRFVDEAIERGARAVLAVPPVSIPPSVALLEPKGGARELTVLTGHLAERIHGHPSRRLALIGITGTNGKTTTAHLLRELLSSAGLPCGLIGTVHVDDGRRVRRATLTTPPAVELSGDLRTMVDAGCRAAVMEISSHGLDQGRAAALRFEAAVFTNITGDHLDYHGTMERYLDAKCGLFRLLSPEACAVINADDPAAPDVRRHCRCDVVTTAVGSSGADATATIGAAGMGGTEAEFVGPWGRFSVHLPLLGAHNVSNALQAASVAWRLGVPAEEIACGLSSCAAPPGRLEPVTDRSHPFAVLVDYAHTDDALASVLSAVRPLVRPGGRLRVVFGCGGDRDRSKRPRMAAAALHGADDVIVTSDNPRTEDPEAIIDDVLAGLDEAAHARVSRIADRGAAIRAGVERCRPGDILVIAGKGHETEQIIGTRTRPFDDRTEARAALDALSPQGLDP